MQGTAPWWRIQATATEVSRPPEKAMPTRSPIGRELRTLGTAQGYRASRMSSPGAALTECSIPAGQRPAPTASRSRNRHQPEHKGQVRTSPCRPPLEGKSGGVVAWLVRGARATG